jgi:hypothetical protein
LWERFEPGRHFSSRSLKGQDDKFINPFGADWNLAEEAFTSLKKLEPPGWGERSEYMECTLIVK